MTYLDYATPARALGATRHTNGLWHEGESVYSTAEEVCLAHNVGPQRIDPPKTRTFAAIRKSVMSETYRRLRKPAASAPDMLKIRAYQYAAALRGEELEHSINLGSSVNKIETRWEFAPDGSRRIREIWDGNSVSEIPNWDWSPSVEQVEPCLF